MPDIEYFMEDPDESIRLDWKTNPRDVQEQALWAGIGPGMQVADVGCGAGKTTQVLSDLVQPGGFALGIDMSQDRIDYAVRHYGGEGRAFTRADAREPLGHLGRFDFVWVRFVLEYYCSSSFELVRNISHLVKPGGILCLIDLDHNCLNHYEAPQRLEQTIMALVKAVQLQADFDPYAGRKLYSHLYRLGYREVAMKVAAHHLIFGPLSEQDAFNWMKKIEVTARKVAFQFDLYDNGYEGFLSEFRKFFADPGRFTYTPIICCSGRNPPHS